MNGTKPLLALIALGAAVFIVGSYIGLFAAPAERYMGDAQRIMYVHVPSAWIALLAFTYAFVCALVSLLRGGSWSDARLEAALETGVVFSLLLCLQGAVWAKPTWGVYWTWDPRLTTTAVMLFAFAGIMALRSFAPDPLRRATWAAVATIVAYVNVPLVYFSVRFWSSLHQIQSSPRTVSTPFLVPLSVNVLGLLLLTSGLLELRARTAWLRREREMGSEDQDVGARVEAGIARGGTR